MKAPPNGARKGEMESSLRPEEIGKEGWNNKGEGRDHTDNLFRRKYVMLQPKKSVLRGGGTICRK